MRISFHVSRRSCQYLSRLLALFAVFTAVFGMVAVFWVTRSPRTPIA